MASGEDLFSARRSLDQICKVPDKIISVYSLEKHVWADSNSEEARVGRKPELQTIEEFQIGPVRPFLNDVLRNMAAPYERDRKDNPIGQGYWVQAEFGSGKSHLLCFLSALALGSQQAWDAVKRKEEQAGRGKRESVYRFWEEGLQAKASGGKRGIFVAVKTLVGSGGGTVGLDDKGRTLTEYILDAVKEQLQLETGKNLSLYPAELLADRFLKDDLDRYKVDLKRFLRDPRFFEEDEFEEIDGFLKDIQDNRSPEYKKSCGNKLWRFYTEYLKVQPQIVAESEAVLKHMVETILAEGYSGVLLVLDEVSLFMKNRDEVLRADDEKTLVVLANRLAKVENLPLWTVCSAQQAIESKMGERNIIADERLKLVPLLKEEQDYYDIVLNRVREIKDPAAISSYYLYYKRGFSWPNSIGEPEFARFFPFHKPALEVLRAVSYHLTTTRSAIAVMHQVLKHQVARQGRDLVRLWELFDETVRYDEDPSGTYASLAAIKTQFETDYRAYEACRRQIDGLTKGYLKVHRDKGVRTVQTLFLYHIGHTRQQGLSPEEIANSVLIERDANSDVQENLEHYESIAENLKKELRQIVQSYDEDHRPRYRFDPVFTGVDPREEFRKARDEAEGNEVMQREAWEHLLALQEWLVRTRQMTLDLSHGVKSIFKDIAPFSTPGGVPSFVSSKDQELELTWKGRQITGLVAMRDLAKVEHEKLPLPAIESDHMDRDFAVFVATRPVKGELITGVLERRKDPRVISWVPGELRTEEKDRLIDFAAYRKMTSDWQGKDTDDAFAVISWVSNALQSGIATIYRMVPESYARGRIDALNNTQMDFKVVGELSSILAPLVDRVLTAAYESRDIAFDPPFVFKREDGVKVINGIVKTGEITKGAKPNQNISAAQNFGFGLKIVKRGDGRKLDTSENPNVKGIWEFLDKHLADEGETRKIETLYKNFMGIGGPKDYGLTRRMVQIYLLCLVREGKLRVLLGPRSGLSYAYIDYSNIADIDFTSNVLGSMTDVQKVARPENWEILRPYAEKLLEETIPVTNDDSKISEYRAKLRTLFESEKDISVRARSQATDLFTALGTTNPYEKELAQAAELFSTDISAGDDIDLLLFALKQHFGYQVFDTGSVSQQEVDDLAGRLQNYKDMRQLLGYERELRTAHEYVAQPLPEAGTVKHVRVLQQELKKKLGDLKPFIDSEVKLKTELIGQTEATPGETGTLASLIRDYTTAYLALHDSVQDRLEATREQIQELLVGDELSAFGILEGITLLQPPSAPQVESTLRELLAGVVPCPSASPASIRGELRSRPLHQCGLTFENANERTGEAKQHAATAQGLLDDAISRKMALFLSPTVVDRLKQGNDEPVIARLLECQMAEDVRAVLLPAALTDRTVVETINKYLKKIVVKKVRLSDFKPSHTTVEKGQITGLVNEIREYLEGQIEAIEDGGDALPVLQLE